MQKAELTAERSYSLADPELWQILCFPVEYISKKEGPAPPMLNTK